MNNTQTEEKILQVPIEDIIPNRFQPRLAFDDASLKDLAASIKQHGIIQPLVLRRINDKYEIIAGERRYKAAKMAGLAAVPAIISNLSDSASAEVAIVENVQRKDLSAIEEARSYQILLDKGYMTQEELAKKMGLSQSAISNKLRLLTLDESVQDAVIKEQISERHARSLLKIKNKDMQKQLLNKIITERLTVKQLEDEIKKIIGNTSTDESEDIPLVESVPKIEDIVNKSVDINSLNNNIESLEDVKTIEANAVKKPAAMFGVNPEKMPNKFFNFLESEAANLDIEEPQISYEMPNEVKENNKPVDLLNKTDNIEMLDDFIIPSVTNNVKIVNDDYLDQVIKTIRGLNFDSDKVSIEEINLPTEYHINIKIKKDKL